MARIHTLTSLAAVWLFTTFATTLRAEERPYLALDPGAHTAAVGALTFSPDSKQLFSASDDKTVRLWDLATRKTIRIFRGQIGNGIVGVINTIAVSPQGTLLAVGGAFAERGDKRIGLIRLYDVATAQIVRILRGHADSVQALRFADDGASLLSGSRDKTAILWSVSTGTPTVRFVGHSARVTAVDFVPGRHQIVTGSEDHTVRIWDAEGHEIRRLSGHDAAVTSLSTAPNGLSVASASRDGKMLIWDVSSGALLRSLDANSPGAEFVGFSKTGKLIATYRLKTEEIKYASGVFDPDTGKKLTEYSGGSIGGRATAIDASGHIVAVGGGQIFPEVALWDVESGQPTLNLNDGGSPKWAVGFSSDGRQLAWGTRYLEWQPNNYGPIERALQLPDKDRRLGVPQTLAGETSVDTLVRARTSSNKIRIATDSKTPGAEGRWNQNLLNIYSGDSGNIVLRTIDWTDPSSPGYEGYRHQAFTFSHDGRHILSGGANGNLLSYSSIGRLEGKFIGHNGYIWALAASPDNRLLASAGSDQTVRLWNLRTRELIVTLYHHPNGRWVMWTPQGFYTGSSGADEIVGWHINKGDEYSADFVTADQLRRHLNRPDIVEKAIVLASADAAVKEAYGGSFRLADILARSPPTFMIRSALPNSGAGSGQASVNILIEQTPDPVKFMRVQVNGRQIADRTPSTASGGLMPGEYSFDVPLGEGANEVRISLSNAIGETSHSTSIHLAQTGALDRRGKLFVLAMGVDKYPKLPARCGASGHSSCDLNYSGADARAFVAAVKNRLGPNYAEVATYLLVNGGELEPTAANILDAIDVLKNATENDTTVLFVAGHGINDGDSYRFLPTDAEWKGATGWRRSSIVPWYSLQEAVETTKGRRLFFVDTCHSGNAYNSRLDNAAYHANFIAYTAARWDQLAIEKGDLITSYSNDKGHGLFTYAVIEGLDNKTGPKGKHKIDTEDLHQYVVKRVEALAADLHRSQVPQYFRGRDAEDFVLWQE